MEAVEPPPRIPYVACYTRIHACCACLRARDGLVGLYAVEVSLDLPLIDPRVVVTRPHRVGQGPLKDEPASGDGTWTE